MSNALPIVSILIVTRNRHAELERCLSSVMAQTIQGLEVVVFDNASIDETCDMVTRQFPAARLIRSSINLGCPSARNRGMRHCSGTYVYMLDDDGWLDCTAVQNALTAIQSDDRIGAVMSSVHEAGIHGKMEPRSRRSRGGQASFSGGCTMFSKAAFDRAGGYPEDFFRQGEEENLALRMLDIGYLCFYEPRSIMYHAPSPFGRTSRPNIFYSIRNTNKTALELWPFPWCMFRVLVNLLHTMKYMFILRDAMLPIEVIRELWLDCRGLRRRPVKTPTFHLYRRLLKWPEADGLAVDPT